MSPTPHHADRPVADGPTIGRLCQRCGWRSAFLFGFRFTCRCTRDRLAAHRRKTRAEPADHSAERQPPTS